MINYIIFIFMLKVKIKWKPIKYKDKTYVNKKCLEFQTVHLINIKPVFMSDQI